MTTQTTQAIIIPRAAKAELARPALAACYRLHCNDEIVFLRHGTKMKEAYLRQFDPEKGGLYRFIMNMGSQPLPAVVESYWDKLMVHEVPRKLYLPPSTWRPRPSVPQPRFRVLAYLYEQVVNKLRYQGDKPVDRDGMKARLASELANADGKPEPLVW